MPAIPQYDQRTQVSGSGLGAGPVAPPSSGVGEGVQDLAGGVGAVVKAVDVVKERDAATWSAQTLSQTQATWMQNLEDQKLKADPGAPNFTPNFLKDFDTQANPIAQGAPTRQSKQFMQERLLALREELMRNAMSFEAASRVQNNITVGKKSVDSAANELVNNPTLFTQRLAERNALFDAMPLEASQRQGLKDYAQGELAKYSVIGRINADPTHMLVELKAGQSTDPAVKALTPDQRVELEQRAKITISAQYTDAEHARELAKQQEEARQKITQNQFLQKMSGGQLSAQEVLNSNLAPFGSGSKDEFINMLKAKAVKTDPALFNELFARAHLPDGNPGKIVDENQLNPYLIDQRLNIEDLGKLREEISGNKTTDGESESKLKNGLFEVAKSTLTRSNPLIGLRDPIGDENVQRFTSWFIGEYAKQRQGGKSPQQLLDPESPDYLGKRLKGYVRSPQQIMQDTLESATQSPATNAVPRKAGESADDYLKRAGGQ